MVDSNKKLHKNHNPCFNSNVFQTSLPNIFDHYNIIDNLGVDFSTFIRKLKKGVHRPFSFPLLSSNTYVL